MEALRIVLVQPAGSLNVGMIARVMKNMGLHHLVLVNPQCNPQGEEAIKMAVHAQDVLEQAECVPDLKTALQGTQRVMATTARPRHLNLQPVSPREGLPWLLKMPAALVFGPEDRGLSNQELSLAQRYIRIDSSAAYPALNLAQAVAVCCYELRQAALESSITQSQLSESIAGVRDSDAQAVCSKLAMVDQIEGFYEQLQALLLEVGFVYPHTAAVRMAKLRRLFNRTQLSERELAMLRGVLRQIAWKIRLNR
ncbi:TrmJ/YjtD family RNA methyltransferase [Synechococcales cyanobacterium C]|uniref:tRNA (cytidine/uridine-2'-O-)-methyltransferase TrmJ n=2 Tax=Petrachloros TaxID=2918834 RepID=A0A8K2ANF3_9CYAN|nr:TrmJ/YjtD family RNA methyltransferase [Petrachloros mirabilis ULC683]